MRAARDASRPSVPSGVAAPGNGVPASPAPGFVVPAPGFPQPPARPGPPSPPSRSRATWRSAAIIAAFGAFALLVGVALAIGSRVPVAGLPGPLAGLAEAPPTIGTEFGTVPIRPYPDLPSSGGPTRPPDSGAPDSNPPESTPPGLDPGIAGGIAGARTRVSAFVAALNANDPDLVNTFMCTGMTDTFDSGMLDGIVPKSLSVGGVSVTGQRGTAFVNYRPTGAADAADPGRAEFGLVVQDGQWKVCGT